MLKKDKVWVQIGVKDGNDEFRDFARQFTPSLIVLVEPNIRLNLSISHNYKDIKNVFIENSAVTARNMGIVDLVHPSKIIDGVEYDDGKFSIVPMDSWGDELTVIKVPSITFEQLCLKYGIKEINFLQIDTEGYDSEIIRSIDFDRFKIDVLKYECWNHPAECFTRHGKNEYGATGIKIVEKLLTERGYKFEKISHDMIAYVEN
jgi:FkbM family methyltransferase